MCFYLIQIPGDARRTQSGPRRSAIDSRCARPGCFRPHDDADCAVRSGRLPGADLAVVTLVPLAAADLVSGLPAAARAWEQVRRVAARVFTVLDAAPDLTAIVAANDLLALGCYDMLEERGVRCPEDISIVGFNDMPFVDRLRPPLTTVRVPQREIGTAAADLMLQRLTDEADGASQILLEPTLVVRGSTAPPRAAP